MKNLFYDKELKVWVQSKKVFVSLIFGYLLVIVGLVLLMTLKSGKFYEPAIIALSNLLLLISLTVISTLVLNSREYRTKLKRFRKKYPDGFLFVYPSWYILFILILLGNIAIGFISIN